LVESRFQVYSALRGCACRFEDRGVACGESGRGKPCQLPHRKVPRHDGGNHTQGLEGNVTLRRISLCRFRGKKTLRVLRVVIKGRGAFSNLRGGLTDYLPHLVRHITGKFFLSLL